MTTTAGALEQHWKDALSKQESRLSGKKAQALVKNLDYATFQKWLQKEDATYGARPIARHIQKLVPVLGELETFVSSITIMIQGGSSIGMFVWGAIRAVLVVGL